MRPLSDYKPEVRDEVARLAFERDAARRAYDALNQFEFIDERWQWVGTPDEFEAWKAGQLEWVARLDAWRAVALQARNLLPQEPKTRRPRPKGTNGLFMDTTADAAMRKAFANDRGKV